MCGVLVTCLLLKLFSSWSLCRGRVGSLGGQAALLKHVSVLPTRVTRYGMLLAAFAYAKLCGDKQCLQECAWLMHRFAADMWDKQQRMKAGG